MRRPEDPKLWLGQRVKVTALTAPDCRTGVIVCADAKGVRVQHDEAEDLSDLWRACSLLGIDPPAELPTGKADWVWCWPEIEPEQEH